MLGFCKPWIVDGNSGYLHLSEESRFTSESKACTRSMFVNDL